MQKAIKKIKEMIEAETPFRAAGKIKLQFVANAARPDKLGEIMPEMRDFLEVLVIQSEAAAVDAAKSMLNACRQYPDLMAQATVIVEKAIPYDKLKDCVGSSSVAMTLGDTAMQQKLKPLAPHQFVKCEPAPRNTGANPPKPHGLRPRSICTL